MFDVFINFIDSFYPPPFIGLIQDGKFDEADKYLTGHLEVVSESFCGKDCLEITLGCTSEDHAKVIQLVDRILNMQSIKVSENHYEAALPFSQRFEHLLKTCQLPCTTSKIIKKMVYNGQVDQFATFVKHINFNDAQPSSNQIDLMHLLAAQRGGAPFIKEAVNVSPMGCFNLVNSKNAEGKTPLMIAVQYGDRAITDALLFAGADYEGILSDRAEPSHGDYKSHPDLIQTLKPRRMKELSIRLKEREGEDHFSFIQEHKIDLSSKDQEGNSLFMQACKSRCFPTATTLINQEGYDFKEMNFKQQTPLIIACIVGHIDAITFLNEQGHENILCDHKDRTGKNAMAYLLLRYKVHGNQQFRLGWSKAEAFANE